MRCAYSVILISSLLLLPACGSSHYLGSSDLNNRLLSLRDARSRQIVQVATNFDSSVKHDAPYFIVCFGEECPRLTPKSPINVVGLSKQLTTTKPIIRSDSYFKKSIDILEQYRVHFDYASAEITDKDKSLLTDFVKTYPHQHKTVLITGFTDNDSKPNGKIGNHWLALERALSVKKSLIALGYPETQVLLEAKFLCCYIDSNESEAGRHNNRRAEISLIHVLQQ